MKYTKKIVELACINASSIDDVRDVLGVNGSYAYTLLKKYNLKVTYKKTGRPNISGRDREAEKVNNEIKRQELFDVTKFLDSIYDIIPYRQRTWHIKVNKLEPEYCICGKPMVFMTKRYKYCSRDCTNKVTEKKRKETMLVKYGVENAFQSEDIKKKIEETCLKRYGTTNGGTSSNGHYKLYTLPSGREIKVQGFENFALDILLKNYDECDLLFGPKEINRELGIIRYNFKGNNHKYFPDFFIKSENKIIEVKSTWTFDRKGKDSELRHINKLKECACIGRGLDFKFMIMTKDGNQCRNYGEN